MIDIDKLSLEEIDELMINLGDEKYKRLIQGRDTDVNIDECNEYAVSLRGTVPAVAILRIMARSSIEAHAIADRLESTWEGDIEAKYCPAITSIDCDPSCFSGSVKLPFYIEKVEDPSKQSKNKFVLPNPSILYEEY